MRVIEYWLAQLSPRVCRLRGRDDVQLRSRCLRIYYNVYDPNPSRMALRKRHREAAHRVRKLGT